MPVYCPQTDQEITECWPVVAQLRPHLNESSFLKAVRVQMEEGYRLACIKKNGAVAGVAGFRLLHSLAWGKFCYVDDLVTDAAVRSTGVGAELIDWLKNFARQENCGRLELDSGVQRFAAHRFYLRERMWISCYHFSLELSSEKKA